MGIDGGCGRANLPDRHHEKCHVHNCLCFNNCSLNKGPTMQTSPPKSLFCLLLVRASLASALALLLLGASAPRLAAQSAPQSYNFNNQSEAGELHFRPQW